MNAGRAIRHLEEAGFSPQQATGLIEVIQDDVLDQIATKDFVELACERVKTELRSDIHALRAELRGDIGGLRTELKGDIGGLGTELKGDIGGLRTEIKGDIGGLRTELEGDIGGLGTELKGDIHTLDRSFGDRHLRLVMWLCGVAVLQTATIIFGTVGLIEILR
jgi:hypothetical protein